MGDVASSSEFFAGKICSTCNLSYDSCEVLCWGLPHRFLIRLLPASRELGVHRSDWIGLSFIRKGIMKSFAQKIQRFLKSEDGPTAVEYAVMLSLIIVVCITAVTSIGTKARTTFTNVSAQLGTAS